MQDYRLGKAQLMDVLGQWNRFLKRKVHLIACGGTAMTLAGVKPSTKDVDFLIPLPAEHAYLLKILVQLGYRQVTAHGWQRKGDVFRFDLFPGKRIHTTELLESPLEPGGNTKVIELSRLYLGILNEYDLISSKLMRGTQVDVDDSLMLVRARRDWVDVDRLIAHFQELASYDISEARVGSHLAHFVELLRKEGLYGG